MGVIIDWKSKEGHVILQHNSQIQRIFDFLLNKYIDRYKNILKQLQTVVIALDIL